MPLEPDAFDLSDPHGRRLYELLIDAYGGVEGVERLVLLAREIGLSTASVNLNRSLDLTLADLLEAAAARRKLHDLVRTAAARNAAVGEALLALLAAAPAAAADAAAGAAGAAAGARPLDAVRVALDAVERSRSPVVIAVESTDAPLEDADLLRTERHLTVSLSPAQLDAIRRIGAEVVDPAGGAVTAVEDVVDAGVEIWTELVGAEPRLKGLLERIAGEGLAQPIAWCGRGDLLAELQVAVLVAHTGDGGADGFVSVGGGHYFMPTDLGRQRTIRPRSPGTAPLVRELDLRGAPDDRPGETALADAVVVLGDDDVAAAITEIVRTLPPDPRHPTRAVVGFGAGLPDTRLVASVLETLPLLSSAPGALARPEVVRALKRALARHATDRALPCIVAAVRAACIRQAVEAGDARRTLEALTWSTWSWIGLPLFPTGYDELLPAAYPHLMDLRTVAAEGWYFNRREGIPDDYAAETLSQEVPPERLFHLYLSGAGGTGKSCFLRYVADRMASRSSTLPIWYRVDAPSSSWENIEDRLREETIAAVEREFGAEPAAALAQLPGRPTLGVFLNEAVARLRAIDPDFDEIVVFIDQLERTFESGDEPDPARLETISRDVAQLLRTVGIGKGVRVFVASRKQYLPDFLRSSRTAQAANLEFNVLQSIEDSLERLAFVQRVIDWCKQEQLVAPHLVLPQDAKAKLADRAQGHPLNMMLSLIQLLSARPGGEIGADDLERLRPWENLFALDLKAAERDDLDWHFLLAMAHARTEIVRIEEVWWRLRMVDPQLTRRVEELTVEGILERLWLFGFLGRTLHVRPYAGHPARFVEFFHANLRDHLLRNVMARGGSDADAVRRRRTGTPPAWRALDRLAGYARDWEQTQQLLPADDVRVLMEQRDKVIEQVTPPGAEPTPRFHLLFLREGDDDARAALRNAATECFAFSALVHDDRGRDTFTQLFPDVDDRVERCRAWLARCTAESRPAVLAYLVETQTPKARKLLTELVLDGRGATAEATAQEIAALLTEPLYAGEFRNQIAALLLREGLDRAHGDSEALPAQVVAFVVAASGGERDALVRVLEYGVESLKADADAGVRDLATALGTSDVVDRWLGEAPAHARYSGARTVDRAELPAGAVLGLAVGEHLRHVVDEARLASWSTELRSRLGVPVPALRTLAGECEADELELRSPRGRLATNLFHDGQVCVDGPRWDEFIRTTPNAVLDSYDLPSGQKVLWLPADMVERAGYPAPARTLDEAVVDWLEDHCRRAFELLMDGELFARIMRDWSVPAAARGRAGTGQEWLGLLRRVIIDLVEEGVPLGPPDGPPPGAIVEQLAWLADAQRAENLTQKVREFVQPWICRAVADESGQVTTLLLDEQLEQSLVDSVVVLGGRRFLALGPRDASRLHAGVRRAVERLLAESGRPPLVLVTDPVLRYPLARLLWQFGTRHPVLSYSELDLDVLITVAGGLVSQPGSQGTP